MELLPAASSYRQERPGAEDLVLKSISNQVNPFSFSTSFRSRKKRQILGWTLMLQSLTSFVCRAKIVTPILKKWFKFFFSSCSDYRCYGVYTVLSSWPCLFPVFVLLLLLLAPHCCEKFNRRPALPCLWAFTKRQLTPPLSEQPQSQADSSQSYCLLLLLKWRAICVCLEGQSFS